MQSCKFYLRLNCTKGAACAYSHDDSFAPKPDSRRLQLCRFHLKGGCMRGSACPYSHTTSDTTQTEAQLEQEPVLRTIGGAVVRFGTGGTITRLSMIDSFSSIRIDGIPEVDATAEKLPVILKDRGYDLRPNETIRAVKVQGGLNASVYITSDDPAFAQRFCTMFQTSGTPTLRAIPVPPKFPPGTVTRQISCNKVAVSWSRPTRAVYLHFETYAEAGCVAGAFNRGEYALDGIAIEAGSPKAYKGKWQILLHNAPFDITEARVRDAMRWSYEIPSYIRLGGACASFNEDAAPAFVSSIFKAIGPVEYITEVRSKGRWSTAVIHYGNELDALGAVQQLHGKRQQFLGEEQLTVRLINASKIKIPRNVHDVIREQIDAAAEANSHGHRLSIKVFPDTSPHNRFVTLSMQGEDKGNLAGLTGTVEGMLSGRAIEVSSNIFKNFVNDKSAAHQLEKIQHANQVLIMIRKARKELVFFGSPAKYEAVQRAILDLSAAKSVFAYQLSENEFAWLHWGGFDKIVRTLGADIAFFNMSSNPKSIVIKGTKEQYQQARSILETRGGSIALEKLNLEPAKKESEVCSICWTPAEDPVTLVCGHLYCAECLEDMCRSSSSDESDFSITCKGESDTCKREMSLNELETHLSFQAFEDVLRVSFASYIRRRADLYHFCPTPDCGFIYTSCEDDTTTTTACLNCMGVTCTACHAQHGTTSCGDYKYKQAGGDETFNKYKREHGGKECPKCKAYIEKIEGCNHMTCSVCSAHICWVCLEFYLSSQECYKHLADVHGGVYDGDGDDNDGLRLDLFWGRAQARGIDIRNAVAVLAYARIQRQLGQFVPDELAHDLDRVD